MTLAELNQYYVERLIVQYITKPKAIGTISCLVNRALCDGLPQQLQTAFNLDTAVGNQLDIIGRIVGVPRNIYGLDLAHEFYDYSDWAGQPPSNGFNTWPTPNDAMLFASWQSNATYRMTDFEFRALIRLRIIYNNAYESLEFIKDDLYAIFTGAIDIVDNAPSGNYSVTYIFKQPYYNVGIVADFIDNMLPKPAGVGINVVFG